MSGYFNFLSPCQLTEQRHWGQSPRPGVPASHPLAVAVAGSDPRGCWVLSQSVNTYTVYTIMALNLHLHPTHLPHLLKYINNYTNTDKLLLTKIQLIKVHR